MKLKQKRTYINAGPSITLNPPGLIVNQIKR
jgi:hypothetical protein